MNIIGRGLGGRKQGFAWMLLFISAAILVRLAFVFPTHIVLDGDEAGGFTAVLHPCGMDGGVRITSGIRYAVAWLGFQCTDQWLQGGTVATVFLHVAGCALWVIWVRRRFSFLAAVLLAVLLAVPCGCADYFSTLLERRQVFLFAAPLFLLVYPRAFRNVWGAGVIGALGGWLWWEEPFLTPVLIWVFWEGNRERPLSKRLSRSSAFLGGLFALFLLGLGWEMQSPQFGRGYLNVKLVGWEDVLRRLRMIRDYFPQFWNDNMPTGYLQGTPFGLRVDPMLGSPWTSFFDAWTVFLFLAAVGGFALATVRFREKRRDIFWLCLLAVLNLLFFLLSGQVWDVLCFRYLMYLYLWVPLGIALGIAALHDRRPRLGWVVLSVLMVIQGGILGQRLHRMPKRHPAEIIVRALDREGLDHGFANHWVTDVVRFTTADRIQLIPDARLNRGLEADVRQNVFPRVAVVDVPGLDDPRRLAELAGWLSQNGYGRWIRHPQPEGWSLYEFTRELPRSPIRSNSPVRPKG